MFVKFQPINSTKCSPRRPTKKLIETIKSRHDNSTKKLDDFFSVFDFFLVEASHTL